MSKSYVLVHNYTLTTGDNGQFKCEIWASNNANFKDFVSKDNNQIAEASVIEAIREADRLGVKVMGLGWLSKAQWILNGGNDAVKYLSENSKTKIVHGNTLTTGTIVNKVNPYLNDIDSLFIVGSTSKIGKALVQYYTGREINVVMFTTDIDRYQKIYNSLSLDSQKYVSMTSNISDGTKYKYWLLGKTGQYNSYIPDGAMVFDYSVPFNKVDQQRVKHIHTGYVKFGKLLEKCDVNHGIYNDYDTLFACNAGALVHLLEGWEHHEVGSIDYTKIDLVIETAKKHGFEL